MIRNETFTDGVCVEAEIVDVQKQSVTYEKNGKKVSTRPMTPDEVLLYASLATDE